MEAALIQSEEIKIPALIVDMVQWNKNSIIAEQNANAIVIESDEENEMAVNTLSKIKTFGKEVEAARVETVKPLNDLTKRVNGMYKPIIESLEKSEKLIKGKMLTFVQEKEQIRREEEAKRQREFEEQKKIAQAQYEADKLKAIAEAKKNKTEPVFVEPVIVEPPPALMEEKTVRTSQGSTTVVKSWKGEIADPMEILKAIIAGNLSIAMVEIKQVELNNFAKFKKQDGIFNGVRVYEHQSINAR